MGLFDFLRKGKNTRKMQKSNVDGNTRMHKGGNDAAQGREIKKQRNFELKI